MVRLHYRAMLLFPCSAVVIVMKFNASTAAHCPNISSFPNHALHQGYGKDPNPNYAPKTPWPLTLKWLQLTLVAVLSDIYCASWWWVAAGQWSESARCHSTSGWVHLTVANSKTAINLMSFCLSWLDTEGHKEHKRTLIELAYIVNNGYYRRPCF